MKAYESWCEICSWSGVHLNKYDRCPECNSKHIKSVAYHDPEYYHARFLADEDIEDHLDLDFDDEDND